ncbi:hypothetical protein GLI01_27960 [Gluconacetobacter liquefaciens]|nr:hypothetical protein GLI01_27960 [Gluconacetobacter liquefaciens]
MVIHPESDMASEPFRMQQHGGDIGQKTDRHPARKDKFECHGVQIRAQKAT